MRAIQLHDFGPADNLVLETVPDLHPGAGEVRIEVHGCGVHLLDVSLRQGEAGPMPLPELPTIPGREVAGVVDRVGDDVSQDWVGRRVVAHLGLVPGGYAEQATTAVSHLFALPDHVGFPEAIAAVGTGRTALGVLELEPPTPGQVVLVPSAAGGLGWLLVQGARAAGATVVAAAGSAERTARLDELGADLVVSYASDGWAELVHERLGGVDLVYDGVGGEVGRAGLELLRPGGRHVMFGYSAGEPTWLDTGDLVTRGISAGWSLGARMAALPGGIPGLAARSLERLAAGEWRPLVSSYALGDAALAHADLESRRALGKVVLRPDR